MRGVAAPALRRREQDNSTIGVTQRNQDKGCRRKGCTLEVGALRHGVVDRDVAQLRKCRQHGLQMQTESQSICSSIISDSSPKHKSLSFANRVSC